MAGDFVIETSDARTRFGSVGEAADFLAARGLVDHDVEPEWHLRWCLERMTAGEEMDVGEAHVVRE
ncbi:hypothetical protein [Jatrophihabitans fulvus]